MIGFACRHWLISNLTTTESLVQDDRSEQTSRSRSRSGVETDSGNGKTDGRKVPETLKNFASDKLSKSPSKEEAERKTCAPENTSASQSTEVASQSTDAASLSNVTPSKVDRGRQAQQPRQPQPRQPPRLKVYIEEARNLPRLDPKCFFAK
jgi:hypothetical protein